MSKHLQYDAPLTDPKDDILDRQYFCKALAKSIIELKASEGFVYGLYGPWGSGKSTIINFVEHFIEEHNKQDHIETKVVVFRFNPWMFSGAKNLTSIYLNQLRIRLKMPDVDKEFFSCRNEGNYSAC